MKEFHTEKISEAFNKGTWSMRRNWFCWNIILCICDVVSLRKNDGGIFRNAHGVQMRGGGIEAHGIYWSELYYLCVYCM